MAGVKKPDHDCTAKCQLRQHGNLITAALTKRSLDDETLAAFIAKTCCNFCNIADDLGRSAVHMTASVGRYAILEWLLSQGAFINRQDYESRSTPLHRALYYGAIDCAVLLLRYAASLELLDADTRCPLQAICRKCDIDLTTDEQNDALVWGSNKNYNLGIGNDQNTQAPQTVDFFRKSNISIEHIALGAYHSFFCDKKGQVYAVGHGKGGRLGIGVENSLPAPKRVKVPLKQSDERVVCISVSRQHSLVLTNKSLVFACGINTDSQLGVRDAGEQLTQFKEVVALRDKGVTNLLRVIACDKHSIAYSKTGVYVWGANQGQFGINANTKKISVPTLMKLADRTAIRFVEANNAATVIYTEEKLIFLFYHEKTKVLKTPSYEDLKSISVVGGSIKDATKGSAAALKLMVLTETNVVFVWFENTQIYYRCNFTPIRLPEIKKILYKSNQLLILSQDGWVYRGKCNQIAVPAERIEKPKPNLDIWQNNDPNRTEISKEHIMRIELKRMPNIDRATDIFCDEDFSSFGALQESHLKYFHKPTLPRKDLNFKKLYHDSNETDAVHDIVFHVDGETFAAHKFIIFSRAPGLGDIIKWYLDKDIYIKFEYLTSKMFEIVLKHIYTNYLPTEEDIDCIAKSLGPQNPQNHSKVCQMFVEHLHKFQVPQLSEYIQSCIQGEYNQQRKLRSNYRLRRSDFPEFYDLRIICENGQYLQAHKCILVSRLEYFEMMFMHSWAESKTVNFSGVPIEYMEPIVDYLYSADSEGFAKKNYSETFLYTMITFCDQYFIETLQNLCELLILDKISIRKCGEILDFAVMYNCKLLQQGCMDYICQNLTRVLCYRSIEQCEPIALKYLNEHYRKMFYSVFDYRQITPFSEAIEDQVLLSFIDGYSVDLDYRINEETKLKEKPKQKDWQAKQGARQYEQEAISTMMRSLSVSESQPTPEPSTGIQPESPIDEKSWSKVTDKRDQRRKLAEMASKVNNTLKQEEQLPGELVVMTSKTSDKLKENTPPFTNATSTPQTELSTSQKKTYHLDLTGLTPQSQKLSQKQRKRLSSESKSGNALNWRDSASLTDQPTTPVVVPNAWGIPSSPSNSFKDCFGSPPTGSSADPTSFANMMRSPPLSARAAAMPVEADNSFSKIQADERKQRDSYERMRNKLLSHTQIEETAIAELRVFYNVDNVDDETITIERKSIPSNINFCTWLKH